MFEAPAIISFICDAFSIVVYFNNPSLFGESTRKSILDINPLRSVLTLVIFSGLRIVAFLPYVWHYQHDRHLVLAQVPYFWHTLNIILIALKAIWELSHKTWAVFMWVMLLDSAISVLCQAICLNHLISTALPERRVVLGSVLHTDTTSADEQPPGGQDSSEFLLGGSRPSLTDTFMNSLRTSLLEARTEWNSKIEKLKESIVDLARASRSGENTGESVVFEELLALFTQSNQHTASLNATRGDLVAFQHDTISNIVRLHGTYPDAVEFYVPQLVVYLLYGAFETTFRLRSAMLGMCAESVSFAHRMHWFIVAFCLSDAGVDANGVALLQQLLQQIEAKGISPAEERSCSREVGDGPKPLHPLISTAQSEVSGYVSPDLRVREATQTLDNSDQDAAAAAAGSVVGTVVESNPYLRFPLELCRDVPDGLNHYSANISFWIRLCDISRDLCQIVRDNRTDELKARLPAIAAEFLPSSTVYAPVGNTSHRIWAINVDESFTFSTKDRAPMFVCLEVVDSYKPSPEKRKKDSPVLPAWVREISSSVRRVFQSGQYDSGYNDDEDNVEDVDGDAHEADVEMGHGVIDDSDHAMVTKERRKSTGLLKSTGSLHHTRSIGFDVGQWDEASPMRPRARQSLDRSSIGSGTASAGGKLMSSPRARSDEHVERAAPFSRKAVFAASAGPLDAAGASFAEVDGEAAAEGGLGHGSVAAEADMDRNAHVERVSSSGRHTSTDAEDPEADRGHASPIIVFKERWRDKERRLRGKSSVGNLPGYRLLPVIVKSNDDLRQEECAGQLIFQMHQILVEGGVDCWLRPYGIIALSPDCGIIEAIPDTVSMDVLRRRSKKYTNLTNFFESFFGEEGSRLFECARENFIRSLGAYCIVCYLLQIKDRHNGNILLDRKGHVIHIDFGFILGLTPGGNIGFESAPFKLTAEMVDLMGGIHSPTFHRFRDICVRTYMELRRHHYRIVLLLDMLSIGNEHLPFFMGHPQRTVDELRQRFKPDVHDQAAIQHVHTLIDLAADNWTTTCYDRYQRCCVGVF